MPCSDAGSMFRDGPVATRMCNEKGEWEEADMTSCTLVQVEEHFLLTWFVLDSSIYDAAMEGKFVQNVSLYIILLANIPLTVIVATKLFIDGEYS